MRLRDLDGAFLRFEIRNEMGEFRLPDGSDVTEMRPRTYYTAVDTLADAQGVEFLCPKCFAQNKGKVGTHMVICWFRNRGVPDSLEPGPGRWNPSGCSLDDLTFIGPEAQSVLLSGEGCQWHGFVVNGDAA